jgi:prepilin-type N-terminal cleavage/methylation domain-containing protein
MTGNKKRLCLCRGFTLVELLIACLIIGALLTIAIPGYFTFRFRAEEQKAINQLNSIYQAQKLYWFDQPESNKTYSWWLNDLQTYVDVVADDGDWNYAVNNGDIDSFEAEAVHLDANGAQDGNRLRINETGTVEANYAFAGIGTIAIAWTEIKSR